MSSLDLAKAAFASFRALSIEYVSFRAWEAQPNWEGLLNHNKETYRSVVLLLGDEPSKSRPTLF